MRDNYRTLVSFLFSIMSQIEQMSWLFQDIIILQPQ